MIKLPGYQITKNQVVGRSSRIYCAIRLADQCPVIIKTHADDHPSNIEVSRFIREYETGRTVSHPNLVKYFSIERLGHGVALIEEACSGIGLDQWLKSCSFSMLSFYKIAQQLVDAVAAIHQQQIIHKDIKPSNIIINPETLEIKVIDFSLATVLNQETKELTAPAQIEGSLPYISPEQSGRMNRALDYRSDFYSLGVTFYEMVTGILPFDDEDPLILIHSKIAKRAKPPHRINTKVSLFLSNVILKLLANTAEERYQSSQGLKDDLTMSFHKLGQENENNTFDLGSGDYFERFQLPHKLYGRDRELKQLLNIFDNAANGASELLMVAGYSGIGKTSLVNEIHKPVTEKRGYFISGKFDQLNRNTAYSAIIEAFQSLVGLLLGESEAELNIWKDKIISTGGPNTHVLIDVIPEIEIITGPQPKTQELSPTETQQRFYFVFRDFIRLFANQQHPLVIFLDDLQWVDSGSMSLLEKLINDTTLTHLLIIGAYRDNEVDANHLLMLGLEELRQKGGSFLTLVLPPLRLEAIEAYLVDALHRDQESIAQLACLVQAKTGGNPFFMNQFMIALHDEELFYLSKTLSYWQWDLEAIKAKNFTDNVIDFVISNLMRLPVETQQALQYAACIGSRFLVSTLAVVLEMTEKAADELMWPAARKGLIFPVDIFDDRSNISTLEINISDKAPYEKYHFLHDRIQQAAHQMVPTEEREALHYKIGKLLLKSATDESRLDQPFEIIDQLNWGLELVEGTAEKIKIANLNLAAARKAKNSSAFQVAIHYLDMGLSILPNDCWESHYQVTFSLFYERAKCEYSTLQNQASNDKLDDLLSHAKSANDRVQVLLLRVLQYDALGLFEEAVKTGIVALRELGITVNYNPTSAEVLKDELFINRYLKQHTVASLNDLPECQDPIIKQALTICASCLTSIYILNHESLFRLFPNKIIALSIKHGNTSASSVGYTFKTHVLSKLLHYQEAHEFGRLAIKSAERFQDHIATANATLTYITGIKYFNEPLMVGNAALRRNATFGYQHGNCPLASWSLWNTLSCIAIRPLSENIIDGDYALKQIRETGYLAAETVVNTSHHFTLNLMGKTDGRFSLSDEHFDEKSTVEKMISENHGSGIFSYYNHKLFLHYLYGDIDGAVSVIKRCDKYVGALRGTLYDAEYCLFSLLTLFQTHYGGTHHEAYWNESEVKFRLKKIRAIAAKSPDNFLHWKLMIEGEAARLSREYNIAIALLEKAIQSANNISNIRDEGIANELLAKTYFDMNRNKVANLYIQEARYIFERWGATEKVKQLNEKYGTSPSRALYEVTAKSGASTISTYGHSSEMLDLSTIIKTSQSTLSEIDLDTLLNNLINNIVENAGAQKGAILLENHNDLTLGAYVTDADNSADAIVNNCMSRQVFRTGREIVEDDAFHNTELSHDDYIQTYKPKSVLCTPIRYKDQVKGVLYLENNITTAAFSTERIAILDVLLSQAAISIENAKLFEENRRAEEEKRKLEAQIQHSQKLESLGVLAGGIAHDFNNLLGIILGNSDLALDELNSEAPVALYINDISKAATHANTLTNQMLAYAGRGKFKVEPMDINNMIQELGHLLTSSVSRQVEINYRLADKLPKIEADVSQVQQVIMNLVTNAADAIKQDGAGSITISTYADEFDSEYLLNTYLRDALPSGQYACLEVKDTGCGMTQATINKIFDPFFTTKPDGRGLGMAAILGIVRGHKGAITIDSEPGEGTLFEVYFPVHPHMLSTSETGG